MWTYVFIPEEVCINELVPHSELMTSIGYADGVKGYLFMRKPNNVFFIVLFDETMFSNCPDTKCQGFTPVGDTPNADDHIFLWKINLIILTMMMIFCYHRTIANYHVLHLLLRIMNVRMDPLILRVDGSKDMKPLSVVLYCYLLRCPQSLLGVDKWNHIMLHKKWLLPGHRKSATLPLC